VSGIWAEKMKQAAFFLKTDITSNTTAVNTENAET
jgi:hypothetical protein